MKQHKLKKKILNHTLKDGKKKTSEKILTKTFKSIQKSQNKAHTEIIKLSIINSTPTYRIIKLKNNKRRKKKFIKEIPAFLSTYEFRSSWALKYLIKTSHKKTSNIFDNQLKDEILLNAKQEGTAEKFKTEIQKQAVKQKKYFKHYRW